METALSKLKRHMAEGDYKAALRLAASWDELGEHKDAIQRGPTNNANRSRDYQFNASKPPQNTRRLKGAHTMSKLPTISKRSAGLLDEFAAAAGKQYWESDQGSPDSAREAGEVFNIAEAALIRRIAYLEKNTTKRQNRKNQTDRQIYLRSNRVRNRETRRAVPEILGPQ